MAGDMAGDFSSDDYAKALRDQTDRLISLVGAADLTARVPSCPDWNLRQLVEHVGQAHRFGAFVVARGGTEPVDPTTVPVEHMPDEPSERDRWLADGAERLIAAVRESEPDGQAWNYTGADFRPVFWLRRMTHETAVHRADAALAAAAPYDLDARLAADGLSEWLQLATSPAAAAFRPEAAEQMRGTGQTMYLRATDEPDLGAEGTWLIRRDPDGVVWTHETRESADLAVRGRAADLLLMLLGRIPVSDPRIQRSGNTELLEHWVRWVTF